MPATYAASVKNARMTAVRDACADGTIELLTAANAVVVTHGLSTTGGTVTGGVWTLALDAASVAAAATGVVTQARIKSAGGTVMVDGLTVGTSGADVTIQNTSVNTGQQVSISAFTVTHAA